MHAFGIRSRYVSLYVVLLDWVCIHNRNQKTENKTVVESLCVRIVIRYLRLRNLHQIYYYPYHCIFKIKTNLAYVMVRLAIDSTTMTGDGYCRILDPFCGSGTLLLEALDVYGPQKLRGCLGMDVSRRSANGARENATAEGYNAKILKFVCCDARSLRRHVKSVQPKAENGNINKKDNAENEEEEEEEAVMDAIITNLPWYV